MKQSSKVVVKDKQKKHQEI